MSEAIWKNAVVPSQYGRPSSVYSDRTRPEPYGRLAFAMIGVVMSLQILFLLVGCTWDFSGDEAEYWAWSRHLDWSYFAKGPLIAWIIRGFTLLFGDLSVKLTGSLMFAARLPSILLGGLTAWGLFQLASITLQSRRAALWSTLLLPAIPLYAIGGVLMTIDTPLVCCWTWAAYWNYRAISRDESKAWLIAGLIGAVGVMAKYSLLALPASVGLFLLLSKPDRHRLWRPGFWLMTLLTFGIGLAPIIIWNLNNHWVAVGQMADRLGFSHRLTASNLLIVLTFIGCEFAVLSGVWWIAGVASIYHAFKTIAPLYQPAAVSPSPDLRRDFPQPEIRAGLLFLLCLWGVIWFACLGASILGETEANWMAPGYVSVLALIGLRADHVLSQGGRRARAYVIGWVVCVAAVVVIHHTDWFYPLMAPWVPQPNSTWAAPLRVGDPTARMRGHQPLAQAVRERLDLLSSESLPPFVLTPTYALASTLSFFLPNQPETYCLSWNFGMTQKPANQHDLWHPNPRNDLSAFKGRSAVVVEDCNMPPSYSSSLIQNEVFRSAEKIDRIFVEQGGIVVGAWDITILHDYLGVANYGKYKLRGSETHKAESLTSRSQH